MKNFKSTSRSAFTLIELLIVVAIIGILASIAVPNYLQAQVRSKVARTQADMRTLGASTELYRADAGSYPQDGDDISSIDPTNFNVAQRLSVLTTPISYISRLPVDPFHILPLNFPGASAFFPSPNPPYTYIYNTFGSYDEVPGRWPGNRGKPDNYTFTSLGPSQSFDSIIGIRLTYDPTNGTISLGDINHSGGNRIPL